MAQSQLSEILGLIVSPLLLKLHGHLAVKENGPNWAWPEICSTTVHTCSSPQRPSCSLLENASIILFSVHDKMIFLLFALLFMLLRPLQTHSFLQSFSLLTCYLTSPGTITTEYLVWESVCWDKKGRRKAVKVCWCCIGIHTLVDESNSPVNNWKSI